MYKKTYKLVKSNFEGKEIKIAVDTTTGDTLYLVKGVYEALNVGYYPYLVRKDCRNEDIVRIYSSDWVKEDRTGYSALAVTSQGLNDILRIHKIVAKDEVKAGTAAKNNLSSDLTIFDNDVIPVYATDTGEQVVIARELHDKLGIKRDYTN